MKIAVKMVISEWNNDNEFFILGLKGLFFLNENVFVWNTSQNTNEFHFPIFLAGDIILKYLTSGQKPGIQNCKVSHGATVIKNLFLFTCHAKPISGKLKQRKKKLTRT